MQPRGPRSADDLARPDLCVIGAGDAGRAAAIGGVALGLNVVLVDAGDGSEVDPTLLLEALRIEAMGGALQANGAGPSFAELRDRLNGRVARAAADRRLARLAAMTIGVIRDTGRFKDSTTLVAGGRSIRARRFMIATGATADRTAGGQAGSIGSLLRWSALPDRLAVVGAGANALSFAQSLCRLSTSVTVRADTPLPDTDPELSALLLQRMRTEGVAFHAELPRDGSGDGSLTIETGRDHPRLQALSVGSAGIETAADGLILDPSLRTTNRRVYAIGRAAGAKSVAESLAQAGIALRAAFFRLPFRPQPAAVPFTTLTDPQIATVGLSESEARALGAVKVRRWPLAETDAGALQGVTFGHLKVITDPAGRVLGAGIVGTNARDLIGVWSLAVAQRLSLDDLATVGAAMPSFSEASRRIALSHRAETLAGPWVRRLARASLWFG